MKLQYRLNPLKYRHIKIHKFMSNDMNMRNFKVKKFYQVVNKLKGKEICILVQKWQKGGKLFFIFLTRAKLYREKGCHKGLMGSCVTSQHWLHTVPTRINPLGLTQARFSCKTLHGMWIQLISIKSVHRNYNRIKAGNSFSYVFAVMHLFSA